MSVLRTGVHGIDNHGVIPVTYMGTGALGLPPVDFNEGLSVFTEGMAKRDTSAGVFAASPIVQGDWDGTGTPDILTLPRGALISGDWYASSDPYQGSIAFRITPEWDGNDGISHGMYTPSGYGGIFKFVNSLRVQLAAGATMDVDISAWTAGTPYNVIIRWDVKNTLDGTNYYCVSINNVHTFGVATTPGAVNVPATLSIGSRFNVVGADAIIEGLTVYRRPLWDGDYGVDVGNGDEVALISAGVDPCTVTGSWDVVFCCPTNAAVGALVTGTGEAWSHPHAAAETNLTDAYCQTAYAASAWADEGTPITPSAYLFDGAATVINCGSAAALDNLPAADFTVDAIVRADGWGENNVGTIVRKETGGTGWLFEINSTDGLRAWADFGTDAVSTSGIDDFTPDGRWHHVEATFEVATLTWRLLIDGIEPDYPTQTAGVAPYGGDAAANLLIGQESGGDYTWDGKIAYVRLSDNLRHASPFVPPPITNPPGVDVNTIEQWNFTDCAGVALTASVTTPGNDGAITAGAGGWNCSRDMDDFAIGDRDFQWGYISGSDAANEGITQTAPGAPLTAGQDYVLRVPVNLGADSNGRARIRVRDMTNAANIVDFDGPLMTGLHTGANNSATLIVAGARFPQSLIGAEVYNITDVNPAGNDCAKGTATSISGDGTTITFAGGLAGGTDNDFDTNDVYRIVWHRTGAGVRSMPADHPWTETFCLELPTIARHGVVADCVSISVKVLNVLASGTVMCHQVELQENLLDNPSLELPYVGIVPIPDGWTNVGLDAGDAQASSTGGGVIHSGADAMQWNLGAVDPEGVSDYIAGAAVDDFTMFGIWVYSDGAGDFRFGPGVGGFDDPQDGISAWPLDADDAAAWTHSVVVRRHVSGAAYAAARLLAGFNQVGTRYLDDVYLFVLDPVTLTATAANQANSAEATGLRIDGRDTCVQPIPGGYFAATSGWTRWLWTPRHDAANLADFDEAANQSFLQVIWGNGTNYIIVYASAANQIAMRWDDGGGPYGPIFWACGADVVAATTYLMEVRYVGSWIRLYQDGVLRLEFAQPVAFPVTPTVVYWGSQQTGDRQVDATYNSP